jgi:hypothetical protein
MGRYHPFYLLSLLYGIWTWRSKAYFLLQHNFNEARPQRLVYLTCTWRSKAYFLGGFSQVHILYEKRKRKGEVDQYWAVD